MHKLQHLADLSNGQLRDMRDKARSQGDLRMAWDIDHLINFGPSVSNPVRDFDDDDPNA